MIRRTSLEDLSFEARDTLESRILMEYILIALSTLIDINGEVRASESLAPYMKMSAQAFKFNMCDLFGIEGDDVDTAGELCRIYETLTGNKGNIHDVEHTSTRIVRVCSGNCPYSSIPKSLCKVNHESFNDTICRSVNPEIGCRFTQMVTAGDPVCMYVIEKKMP